MRRDLDCGGVWISGPRWMWQGWRWDANICNLDGAWMEVTQESWDLNACDAGSGWRWDTNLGTWIALRWDLEGAEIQSTRPGWGWDGTWIELRCTSWDVDRVIWDLELRYNSLVEKGPGWRWDTHLETFMGLRWCLDGTKMHFGGAGWRWDVTWM